VNNNTPHARSILSFALSLSLSFSLALALSLLSLSLLSHSLSLSLSTSPPPSSLFLYLSLSPPPPPSLPLSSSHPRFLALFFAVSPSRPLLSEEDQGRVDRWLSLWAIPRGRVVVRTFGAHTHATDREYVRALAREQFFDGRR